MEQLDTICLKSLRNEGKSSLVSARLKGKSVFQPAQPRMKEVINNHHVLVPVNLCCFGLTGVRFGHTQKKARDHWYHYWILGGRECERSAHASYRWEGWNPGKVPDPTFSISSLARSTKEEDEQRRKCRTVLVLLDCYYLLRRFRCVFSRNQGRGFKNAVG
jgi:hypothetical protein